MPPVAAMKGAKLSAVSSTGIPAMWAPQSMRGILTVPKVLQRGFPIGKPENAHYRASDSGSSSSARIRARNSAAGAP